MQKYCQNIVDKIKSSRRILPDANEKQKLNEFTERQDSPKTISTFIELEYIEKHRRQTFTAWPHNTPDANIMSSNGWYYCYIHDRTLCIYCNTICQGWTPSDNPYEVHKRLAPKCPFIQSKFSMESSSYDSKLKVNKCVIEKLQITYPLMRKTFSRTETFRNCSDQWNQTSPAIDDFVNAGFFYSAIGNTVTCFYCGGSLHQWNKNDKPIIEHARWFPRCLYARQLCGEDLYEKIQLLKRKFEKEKEEIDENILKRLINARLDLPIVEKLRSTYRLSVIKRCLEDQFKLNKNDFQSDNDFMMACFILQKQINIIQGDPANIRSPRNQNQIEPSSLNIPKTTNMDDCVICLSEERQVAAMPCGHLCTCVACGYSLDTCAICRTKIQSFVRIYA